MKRTLSLIGLCGISLLLLTGCEGKSTLKCNKNESETDVSITASFNDNKIESMNLEYLLNLSNYSEAEINTFNNQDLCSGVKTGMEDFKDTFSDCKQNIENKNIKITANFDINKIKDDKLNMIQTPDNAKKELENSGYKCKIEK